MVPKRRFHEEGGENLEFPVPESKRRPTFRNVVGDVMRDVACNEVAWEHFFRSVVREEVERVILPYLNSSPSRTSLEPGTSTSGGSGLQLHFYNKLPPTIFTGSRVEAEDATPLQIALIDASTKAVVRSGPLSSLKLEIIPLNGEFGSDDKEDWTEKEFNDYIVRERDGKRPLVTGEINVTLKDGVACLGDIIFTDNSSWIRNRRFRLAARVATKAPTDVRIREARSTPFMVKDHRGELYRKHHPPSLGDEIWRLEKIAKEGAFHKRLSSCRINTVKDFLQWYVKDPSGLRNVFGGISNRTWNTIIEHAKACHLDDDKLYAYHRHEQDVSLVFNSIYKVVGAILNGQYCSLDELNTHHKMQVENLKQHAYRNERDMVVIDPSDIFGPSRALPSLQAESFNGPNQDLQQIEFPFNQQDEPVAIQLGFNHASTSTSYQTESGNQFVVSLAQAGVPMQAFNPALRNSLSIEDFSSIQYNGESSTWLPLSGLQGSIVPTGHLVTENIWSPPNAVWGQTNTFCFGSTSDTEAGHFAHIPTFVHNAGTRTRPKACWCKLRAAIKWWLSFRRDVAAKRMARPLYLNY